MRLMNVINSLGSTGHCTGDSSESIEIGLINECGPQKLHELTEGRQGDRGMKGREVSIGCGVLQIVFQLATIFLDLMQLRLPR